MPFKEALELTRTRGLVSASEAGLLTPPLVTNG